MLTTIQQKIENDLSNLLRQVIFSQQSDPAAIRMVVLTPDSLFENIHVYIRNEWRSSFFHEDGIEIGRIDISQWLDEADKALEKIEDISSDYIPQAEAYLSKYLCAPPSVTFDHIRVLGERYQAYLICLRESLFSCVENAIRNVATSCFPEYDTQLTGFATCLIPYQSKETITVQAFNHPGGIGPFFKTSLALPGGIRSYPYLTFSETGLCLFIPDGDLYEKSEDKSEIYTIDAEEINYIRIEKDSVILRLKDEFRDWEFSPGRINKNAGDLTEKAFFNAFDHFLSRFPEKRLDMSAIPDPLTDQAGFERWVNVTLANNLPVAYADLTLIFRYGEEAFRCYISLLPQTTQQYRDAVSFLAEKLKYSGKFEKSFDLLKDLKNLSADKKITCLEVLLLSGQKALYSTWRQTLENDSRQMIIQALDWFWTLQEQRHDPAILKNLEKELLLFQKKSEKNNETQRLISVLLTILYVLLDERDKAIYHLQSVPAYESVEQLLLRQKLGHVTYIMDAYEPLSEKEHAKAVFREQVEKNTLLVTENTKPDRPKTRYEYCFYTAETIPFSKLTWARPIGNDVFIAVRKNDKTELILARTINDTELEIIQTESLSESVSSSSCTYAEGVLYLTDKKQGILTYSVTPDRLVKQSVQYKNTKAKPSYENIAVANGYLYASNNRYLEIYELNKPGASALSDTLFIDSGYNLFVHKNLLVVSSGGGLLILADITDKTCPTLLSTITEDKTPDRTHVEFIDHYMISRSVFDISNPASPQWVSFAGDDLAPTYYFASAPAEPVISTGEEFLFTTLKQHDDGPYYTNWRESLNPDNLFYERALFNLATAWYGDRVITYGKDEIRFWEKGPAPSVRTIDLSAEVEQMVWECFQYLKNQHSDFSIGKVLLQNQTRDGSIDIVFHSASTLAFQPDTSLPSPLPVVSSYFNLNEYCEEALDLVYDPAFFQFTFDGVDIVRRLIHHPHFEAMAARYVLAVTNNDAFYRHFPHKTWQPFRSGKEGKAPETLEEILTGNHAPFIQQLKAKIAEDRACLEELLALLNKEVPSTDENTAMSDTCEEDDASDMFTMEESLCFVYGPEHFPPIEDSNGHSRTSAISADRIKTRAFELLCSYPDRQLLLQVLVNGITCGVLHYDLKAPSAPSTPDEFLIPTVTGNQYGLWDEFGKDPELRASLMSGLSKLSDPISRARVAYLCGHLSHPELRAYLLWVLNEGISYNSYIGGYTGINISTLPVEALRPVEKELRDLFGEFESTTDPVRQIEADQQIVYICDMLQRLGYDQMPESVSNKMDKALRQQEEYPDINQDDDEYDEESAFLVSLYRARKVQRLLKNDIPDSGPLWPLEETTEPYTQSWFRTIDQLWKTGTEQLGGDFTSRFVTRLSENITLEDKVYEHDRMLATEIVQFTFHNIQQRPELATLIEPLVLAIQKHQDKFAKKTNIAELKNKSKFALLQSAWNDVKNNELDLAEEKAKAVLALDPDFAQVYFLQARTLWLREGIEVYLSQQDVFIQKASHDIVTLARLYNLTGCALDVGKNYEEALSYFQKAALSVPGDPIYTANVAELCYKLRKPKEAMKHARAAIAAGNHSDTLNEIINNKGVIEHS